MVFLQVFGNLVLSPNLFVEPDLPAFAFGKFQFGFLGFPIGPGI